MICPDNLRSKCPCSSVCRLAFASVVACAAASRSDEPEHFGVLASEPLCVTLRQGGADDLREERILGVQKRAHACSVHR